MNLGEFHTEVQGACGRGTALNAQIISATRRAAKWLERNCAYKYMEQLGSLVFNPDAALPHVVTLPPRLRNITLARLVLSDGSYARLRKIDPRDCVSLDTARPSGYSTVGYGQMVLDTKPDAAYFCELRWNAFTAWPTALTATNWLLENAEDALLGQTMMGMAVHMRDQRMFAMYKLVRDEALHTLETTEGDYEESNRDDSMGFDGGGT